MDVEDLVKSYFRLGFSNKEILCLLAHQHGVIISKRTLQRLCRKLNLFRRKNQTDIEEIASFVQSEMATSGRLQGYRWLHLRAIRRGYEELFSKTLINAKLKKNEFVMPFCCVLNLFTAPSMFHAKSLYFLV